MKPMMSLLVITLNKTKQLSYKIMGSTQQLTHCGLVKTYGNIDLAQNWLRYWLVAWRHQAITWTKKKQKNKCVVRARHDYICGHLSFKYHSCSCSTQWCMHCARRSAVSQYITWTNVGSSSAWPCDNHLRAISPQEIPQPSINKSLLENNWSKMSFRSLKGQWAKDALVSMIPQHLLLLTELINIGDPGKHQ